MIELFWTETEVQNQEIETKTKIQVFFGLFDKNVGWVFPRKFILILFRERGSSVIDVTVEGEEVNQYQ